MSAEGVADYGSLAAALAKAQATFPAIPRDKEVTVTTKAGGSYKFKYAPLDSILNAVRKPLADNGLAVAQLIDSDADGQPILVTSLLHAGGAALTGRTPIPQAEGIQAFGSAITYLRRYALQAMLGIAAEEDDDGNTAAGNRATFGRPASGSEPVLHAADGSLIGTAEIGKGQADFELRQGPDDEVLAFRLVAGRKSIKVIAHGPLALALISAREDILGKTVTCWGRVDDESFTPEGKKQPVVYQVLTLDRLAAGNLLIGPIEIPEPDPEVEEQLTAALAGVP